MRESPQTTVLAIAPVSQGFGYAVFEGQLIPVDWAVKNVREQPRNRHALKHVRTLIDKYQPTVVVLEDYAGRGSRRCERIRRLIDSIEQLARKKKIRVRRFSRSQIRACFAAYNAKTKDQIARVIAMQLPEFGPRVPPKRKIWKSVDYRMAIFDAVALIFVCCAMGADEL